MISPKKSFIYILLVVGLAIAVVVLANIDFFWKRSVFVFQGRPANLPVTTEKTKAEPNILEIPSLSISAPVVYVDKESEAVFQDALQNGVVHFPGSAMPGQVGNVYIFGHSSDFFWNKGQYKTVFALLPKIEPGSEVYLSDSLGKSYTYTVTSKKVVSSTDLSVLSQNTQGKKILTLQTSYPIGTALKRYVVIAELEFK